MKESHLQHITIAHLQKCGYTVNKIMTCTLNGWPDLEAYRRSSRGPELIFIEVKTPDTFPDKLQLFRHEQIRNMGFKIFVIHRVSDLAFIS